jgi:hypothetical protein
MSDQATLSLRHTVATLAYRGARAVRQAPPEFQDFQAGSRTRKPAQILAHIGDLLDWALSIANGKQVWHDSAPLPWEQEVARFFTGLEVLDRRLAADQPIACSAEKLFQGPIADALTHVGQIAMLRGMAGYPIGGENYAIAHIEAGRVGKEQAKPVREFE